MSEEVQLTSEWLISRIERFAPRHLREERNSFYERLQRDLSLVTVIQTSEGAFADAYTFVLSVASRASSPGDFSLALPRHSRLFYDI